MKTIFEAIVKSDRRGRGAAGETYAAHLLEKSGYKAQKRERSKCGDLMAIEPNTGEFWNVEVKTAAKRPDGKFTFQLIVDGHTDYRHSDYVLLLAVHQNGVVSEYLIPTRVISGRKTITLPKNLNESKWSEFRVKRSLKLGDVIRA